MKEPNFDNRNKKIHTSDVSIDYITSNEFDIAYNFLIDNMDLDKREYIRNVLLWDNASVARIIRKYRELQKIN